MTRRLLTTAHLADKLGYVKDDGTANVELFYRNRRQLENQGLPQPAIGNGRGQRWDEQAIDLWLDGRIPLELRKAARIAPETDWSHELDRRAQSLTSGGAA
jgi:hypothetical protein